MVPDFAEKERILRAGGYSYSFDRELCINKRLKKAFSVEFVEDHSKAEIEELAFDTASSPSWRFFFNTKPSAAAERELADMLG